MTITPSHIIEYLYCHRFTYFEYVLTIPQFEGKLFKVQKGRMIHEKIQEQNKNYLRKKIGVVKKYDNQYLTNKLLRGQIDEVLLLKNETMAPLDYKYAVFHNKIYDTYKTQLFCYAWLIEENFNKEVKKGFLVYVRSKYKLVEVEINTGDKEKVKTSADEILKIINNNFYPKATKYKKRCINCTYKNICIS